MKARLLRLREPGGFTLAEMLVVLAILSVVVVALVQLFVSASSAEVNMVNRFRAQQNARLALDTLRREIHCASAAAPTSVSFVASVTIVLPAGCAGGARSVTWCTTGSGQRWKLWRIDPSAASGQACTGGILRADYLTTNLFVNYNIPGNGLRRATLGVHLPVDVDPVKAGGVYVLDDDIVLRNVART